MGARLTNRERGEFIHISDDFSVLSGPYAYVEATQEKELNSLHALKGIGKGEKSGIIHIVYL